MEKRQHLAVACESFRLADAFRRLNGVDPKDFVVIGSARSMHARSDISVIWVLGEIGGDLAFEIECYRMGRQVSLKYADIDDYVMGEPNNG
jgi:hypothetical protein